MFPAASERIARSVKADSRSHSASCHNEVNGFLICDAPVVEIEIATDNDDIFIAPFFKILFECLRDKALPVVGRIDRNDGSWTVSGVYPSGDDTTWDDFTRP